ncbi:hypothetical protein CF319_g9636, partial [Tilletia indica]
PLPAPPSSPVVYLAPPPSSSVAVNGVPLPYAPRLPGGVPSIPWDKLWASLPASVVASLSVFALSAPSPFRLPGPFSPEAFAARPPSAAWLPMAQDPSYPAFPWHLLTVSGQPLLSVSPASVRKALSPTTPRAPRWTFPAPASPAFWSSVWSELEASPLSVDLRSSCLLVLGRNLWTYRPKDGLCPAGCPVPDSPSHGICAGPEALMVWHACLPLLRVLGVSATLSFTPHDIVGAWPHLLALRPRLVLWRNVVLFTLHTARTLAGRDARVAARPPDFCHCATTDVLSVATAALVSSLTTAWSRLSSSSSAQARFRARWLVGSSLLHEATGVLVASPVLAAPGQPLP